MGEEDFETIAENEYFEKVSQIVEDMSIHQLYSTTVSYLEALESSAREGREMEEKYQIDLTILLAESERRGMLTLY